MRDLSAPRNWVDLERTESCRLGRWVTRGSDQPDYRIRA